MINNIDKNQTKSKWWKNKWFWIGTIIATFVTANSVVIVNNKLKNKGKNINKNIKMHNNKNSPKVKIGF